MFQRVLERIYEQKLDVDVDIIEKAYYFSEKAHENQFRESGEPYLLHPVEVALIVIEMGLDTDTICAALLHDVVEDTRYTYEDIKNEFNEDIANLVEGVTKLDKIQFKSKEEQQAENIRKMLIAMAKDVRVILIKLADRLHNMRTLKYCPPEKQKRTANETLDIYAPLAHRLGISKIKWELEDLSLRYTEAEVYYDLVNKVAKKRAERENAINEIIKVLREKLNHAGIKCDIDGRPKHFYSIYRKMAFKDKNFDQIFDLLAIRIIVDTVRDCYAALGIAHTLWKPIPGRFKDYIAMPKPNMYQSLHSTVIGPAGQPFEIQIRTWDMHRTAEYGIAAHWKYKEGIDEESGIEDKLSWLGKIIEYQKESKDAKEFMETVKIDLFSDEVFVFTPKGNIIDLPIESTPIDFAYRIHTDVGNKCIGAKVNGRMVTLDSQLKTGDIVEVITSTTPKGPSRDWLNIVKSSNAKNKIRQYFKKTFKEENYEKGKESFEKELKKQGLNLGEVLKSDCMDIVLKRLNYSVIDYLYAAIGSGAITAAIVASKVKDELKRSSGNAEKDIKITDMKQDNKRPVKREVGDLGIVIDGERDLLVRFAKCCSPVPGDEISGFITKGRGVSVHRSDCVNFQYLSDEEPQRVIHAEWVGDHANGYIAEIQIEAIDRPGLLTEITTILSTAKISMRAINARSTKDEQAIINLSLEVANVTQLSKVIRELKNISGISSIFRVGN